MNDAPKGRQRGTAQVGGSPEIDYRLFEIKMSIATFFFEARGAKKKVIKKETPFGVFRRLRAARRPPRPPLAQTFEKV